MLTRKHLWSYISYIAADTPERHHWLLLDLLQFASTWDCIISSNTSTIQGLMQGSYLCTPAWRLTQSSQITSKLNWSSFLWPTSTCLWILSFLIETAAAGEAGEIHITLHISHGSHSGWWQVCLQRQGWTVNCLVQSKQPWAEDVQNRLLWSPVPLYAWNI